MESCLSGAFEMTKLRSAFAQVYVSLCASLCVCLVKDIFPELNLLCNSLSGMRIEEKKKQPMRRGGLRLKSMHRMVLMRPEIISVICLLRQNLITLSFSLQ